MFFPSKTPRRVTIVRWGVFIFGAIHGWQVWAIAHQAAVLHPLNPTVPTAVRLIVAAVWGIVWMGLAGALWAQRPWVRWLVPLTILLYTLYHFLLLAAAISPYAQGGWWGNGLLGLAAVLGTTWALRQP